MDCSDYEWELFFRITNIIIPKILQKAHSLKEYNFCVVGGKAIDAHTYSTSEFNYIGSPDWDINTDDREKMKNFIETSLSDFIPNIQLEESTLKITREKKNDKGEVQKEILDGIKLRVKSGCILPYFIDIVEKPQLPEIEVINNIPYINRVSLFVDLFQVLYDRELKNNKPSRTEEHEEKLKAAERNVLKYAGKTLELIEKYVPEEDPYPKDEEDEEDEEDSYNPRDRVTATFEFALEYTAKFEQIKHQASEFKKRGSYELKKLTRTRERLALMIKQNQGKFKEMCQTCHNDITKVIEGVGCDIISSHCKK